MRRKGQRLAATAMALVLSPRHVAMTAMTKGAPTPRMPPTQASIGEGEGALSVLAWPYYAEDGTQDPNSTG